jgi:hypothetical protein
MMKKSPSPEQFGRFADACKALAMEMLGKDCHLLIAMQSDDVAHVIHNYRAPEEVAELMAYLAYRQLQLAGYAKKLPDTKA